MVYKVKVVIKNNISEIRYITESDVISDNVNLLVEVDAIRDIANNIMAKQPSVTYNEATKLAKEIRYGAVENINSKQSVVANNIPLPGIEERNEQEEILFGLKPTKQLILTKQ